MGKSYTRREIRLRLRRLAASRGHETHLVGEVKFTPEMVVHPLPRHIWPAHMAPDKPHQMTLFADVNPQEGLRREPRQRKGEAFPVYLTRYATWWHQNFRVETEEEAKYRAAHGQWLLYRKELYFRSVEVYAYEQTEKTKRKRPGKHAVFFFFGGETRPGINGQYINQVTLNHLLKIKFTPGKASKQAVSFTTC